MSLKNCKLYVIIDSGMIGERDILKIAEDVLRGGADIIQLRDKSSDDKTLLQRAKAIKKIANKYKRPFILNDRADLARIIDADGVHLGQDDIPIEEARKIIGKKIIGISTHSVEEAKNAKERGADYIGIGPIFKTKTKKRALPIGLSVLRRVSKAIDIPSFAIGGISPDNIPAIKKSNATQVAIASSAIKNREVCQSVRKLKEKINR